MCKKIIALLLASVMLLSFISCGEYRPATGGGSGSWTASSSLYVTTAYLPKISSITVTNSNVSSISSSSVVYNDDGTVTITVRAKMSNKNTLLVATEPLTGDVILGSQETETVLFFKSYYSTIVITVKGDCAVSINSGNASDYQ